MNLREWALPFYTILMQMAYGTFVILWVWRARNTRLYDLKTINRIALYPMAVIVFTLFVGMFGAHFHLSSPFLSFFALLNLQQSWLSREIFFSTSFSILTFVILWLITFHGEERSWAVNILGVVSIGIGFFLVFSMSSIYLLPAQVAWNSITTHLYFLTTCFLLGAVTLMCLWLLELQFAELKELPEVDVRVKVIGGWFGNILGLVVFFIILSIVVLIWQLTSLSSGDLHAQTSYSLFTEVYLPLLFLKFAFGFIGVLILGVSYYRLKKGLVQLNALLQPVTIACLLILSSEIIGRFIFYATHIRIGV